MGSVRSYTAYRLPSYQVLRSTAAKGSSRFVTSAGEVKKEKFCRVVVVLPDTPVNLYVNGTLMAEKAARQFVMQTPALPAGQNFEYAMVIEHCGGQAKRQTLRVTGIRAGGLVVADFRRAKPGAAS